MPELVTGERRTDEKEIQRRLLRGVCNRVRKTV
jgi:hypothetical protein